MKQKHKSLNQGENRGWAGTEMTTPSPPLQLNRTWSGSETATAWALMLLSALAGALLWFKN